MDMGIIANLKLNYKNYLSREKNICFENNAKFSVSILDAMLNLKNSWENISELTIQNCFIRFIRFLRFKRFLDSYDLSDLNDLNDF